jgi:hypothetical protein
MADKMKPTFLSLMPSSFRLFRIFDGGRNSR